MQEQHRPTTYERWQCSDSCCVKQGRHQVKTVGWTHMASAKREPITGSVGKAPVALDQSPGQQGRSPWSWKPVSFWMPNGSIKFDPFSVFCKLTSQAPNATDPEPYALSPVKTVIKITEFVPTLETAFGKSGVNMFSDPSPPVATPQALNGSGALLVALRKHVCHT